MSENAEKTVKNGREEELALLKKKEADSLSFLKNMTLIMVILTIIYVVDEITSNINQMRTYMIFDLFKIPGASTNTDEYASAVSKMAITSIPTYLFMFLMPSTNPSRTGTEGRCSLSSIPSEWEWAC